MKKENEILQRTVFDFTIFSISEAEIALKEGLGRNQEQLMVVYQPETNSKENLDFLKKVLAAVNLDIDKDILLIKAAPNRAFSFSHLKSLADLKYIIFFGISPTFLGIHSEIVLYTPTLVDDCTLLCADPLSTISNDRALKGALWGALKAIFETK